LSIRNEDRKSTQKDSVTGEFAATPTWFAVETSPRHEKKVAAELTNKGVDCLLPLFAAERQWSDRRQVVQLPVFPGYVFVQIAPISENRLPVLQTNGVRRFVGVRGTGIPIEDSEMDAVRRITAGDTPFQPHPYPKTGQRVRIRDGSLRGIEGILLSINGDQSLVVSLELIGRSMAMRLTGYAVDPA